MTSTSDRAGPDLAGSRLMEGSGPVRRWIVEDVDTLSALDVSAMVDRAWQLDYAGDARPDFNEAFLKRFAEADGWFAVVALDDTHRPLGFELAVPRTPVSYTHLTLPTI